MCSGFDCASHQKKFPWLLHHLVPQKQYIQTTNWGLWDFLFLVRQIKRFYIDFWMHWVYAFKNSCLLYTGLKFLYVMIKTFILKLCSVLYLPKGHFLPCSSRAASEWILRALPNANKTLIKYVPHDTCSLSPAQLSWKNNAACIIHLTQKNTQVQSRPLSCISHWLGGRIICSLSIGAPLWSSRWVNFSQHSLLLFLGLSGGHAPQVWLLCLCTSCLVAFYMKPHWNKCSLTS